MMKFCSVCLKSLEKEDKTCSNRQCLKLKSTVCDLALLSIEDRLKQLYGQRTKMMLHFKS